MQFANGPHSCCALAPALAGMSAFLALFLQEIWIKRTFLLQRAHSLACKFVRKTQMGICNQITYNGQEIKIDDVTFFSTIFTPMSFPTLFFYWNQLSQESCLQKRSKWPSEQMTMGTNEPPFSKIVPWLLDNLPLFYFAPQNWLLEFH